MSSSTDFAKATLLHGAIFSQILFLIKLASCSFFRVLFYEFQWEIVRKSTAFDKKLKNRFKSSNFLRNFLAAGLLRIKLLIMTCMRLETWWWWKVFNWRKICCGCFQIAPLVKSRFVHASNYKVLLATTDHHAWWGSGSLFALQKFFNISEATATW